MLQKAEVLARIAEASAFAGLPLWALSYVWLPLAWMGLRVPGADYLVIIGEVGALLAGTFALVIGLTLRKRFAVGIPQHRSAARASVVGGLVLLLVIALNLVGIVAFTLRVK